MHPSCALVKRFPEAAEARPNFLGQIDPSVLHLVLPSVRVFVTGSKEGETGRMGKSQGGAHLDFVTALQTVVAVIEENRRSFRTLVTKSDLN